MDPKHRNAAALRSKEDLSWQRINDLLNEFLNQYRAILAVAREDNNPDFSQSAQKELSIKEGAMAIVRFPDRVHHLHAR
ncbi:uncharacterized protein N0V89_003854 [Didymosphaeria variabile]|uniref:Uncharacterized protein n=1 Tax=Didymosphaeria variabile TaxID=1932322 RepID=A0A9W8XR23_9PLEO|nr:uncharacterized protein N0V89_003854 [Didymosphaeria variabile]KAJ4355833.1 hypothetical protein N0V89_003854 [Didymosphaeria variabile]